jgi:hypothetical protein
MEYKEIRVALGAGIGIIIGKIRVGRGKLGGTEYFIGMEN